MKEKQAVHTFSVDRFVSVKWFRITMKSEEVSMLIKNKNPQVPWTLCRQVSTYVNIELPTSYPLSFNLLQVIRIKALCAMSSNYFLLRVGDESEGSCLPRQLFLVCSLQYTAQERRRIWDTRINCILQVILMLPFPCCINLGDLKILQNGL